MEIYDYIVIVLCIGIILYLVFFHVKLNKELHGKEKYGLDLFDQPVVNVDLDHVESLMIIQALGDEGALAKVILKDSKGNLQEGINVYMHHTPKHPYYDKQLVIVPDDVHAEQVGVYRYVNVNNCLCTVPAISFTGNGSDLL